MKTFNDAKDVLLNILDNSGLSRHAYNILGAAKPSISIWLNPSSDKFINIADSKLGGNPDLPENFSWPVYNDNPLSFVLQINLEQIKEYDVENLLPPSGLLLFFYSVIDQTSGMYERDKGSFRVIYLSDTTNLVRLEAEKLYPEIQIFNTFTAFFDLEASVPSQDRGLFDDTGFSDDETENYNYLEISAGHKLLGYPLSIQADDMEMDCERITSPKNYNFDDPELARAAAKWMLLLQLDTEYDAEMEWGDGGKLYFWIKEDDLKNRNFDNAWMIMQS